MELVGAEELAPQLVCHRLGDIAGDVVGELSELGHLAARQSHGDAVETMTAGGTVPFDESLYAAVSGKPEVYAAALKLGELGRDGELDEKIVAELEKR